jgi:hypothetical protein
MRLTRSYFSSAIREARFFAASTSRSGSDSAGRQLSTVPEFPPTAAPQHPTSKDVYFTAVHHLSTIVQHNFYPKHWPPTLLSTSYATAASSLAVARGRATATTRLLDLAGARGRLPDARE